MFCLGFVAKKSTDYCYILLFCFEQINVLKEIGCIDDDLVVQIKGRVACEMNSGEELICTECLFENQLENLEPEEAVAVMSAFVFQQKNTSEPSLTPKLSAAVRRLAPTMLIEFTLEFIHVSIRFQCRSR